MVAQHVSAGKAHHRCLESRQLRIGVYDCHYVALAERENCEMVTDDGKLLKNVPGVFPSFDRLRRFHDAAEGLTGRKTHSVAATLFKKVEIFARELWRAALVPYRHRSKPFLTVGQPSKPHD